MNEFNTARTFENPYHIRRVYFWYSAKQKDNGLWNVHFYGDWAPRADFTATDDELFTTIDAHFKKARAEVLLLLASKFSKKS
jgi:hypothetical protein